MTPSQVAQSTIVVVEDDPTLAQLLRDRFTYLGYLVCLAESAAEAETVLESLSPDLVLIDLMPPSLHGLVLCANLKDKLSAPIIICGCAEQQHDAVLAFKLGAADFVPR